MNSVLVRKKEKNSLHACPFRICYLCTSNHIDWLLLSLLVQLSELVFERVNSRRELSWCRFDAHRQMLPFSAWTLLDDDSSGASQESTLEKYFHFGECLSNFPETECIADIWVLGSTLSGRKGFGLSPETRMEVGTLVRVVGVLSEQT